MTLLPLLLSCEPSHDSVGTDSVDTAPLADTDLAPLEEVPPRVPDVIVDCAGGADFVTIQDAIAASLSGTKIGLRPCIYHGDVDFIGKSLDIFGLDGSAVTTIQGSGYGPAVLANHGESVGTRLAGVTVTGGASDGYHGSGVAVDFALLQLEDVVFTHNDVGQSVLYASGAFLELIDVSFLDNEVEPTGGITVMTNGSALAQRLTIECTDADYGMFMHNASLLMDSDIDCGRTYGIYNQGNGVHLRRSRVQSDGIAVFSEDRDDTRNERSYFYNSALIGGDTAVLSAFVNVRAENNVFWGGRVGIDLRYVNAESYVTNSYARGSVCGVLVPFGEVYELGWNAVADGSSCASGHDTVDLAPGFVAAPEDFTLQETSPLIDAGDPDRDRRDWDGSRNDIGMYGGREGQGQP